MGTKKVQPKVIPLPAVRNTYDAKSAHGENYVGRQIRAARKARGLTIPALAEKLSEYKVSVTRHGVTKWETGGAVPNAYQLVALCCALELKDGFPFFTGWIGLPPGGTGPLRPSQRRKASFPCGRCGSCGILPHLPVRVPGWKSRILRS